MIFMLLNLSFYRSSDFITSERASSVHFLSGVEYSPQQDPSMRAIQIGVDSVTQPCYSLPRTYIFIIMCRVIFRSNLHFVRK